MLHSSRLMCPQSFCSYDNPVLLKRHHEASPVIINGYYITNGVASCLRGTYLECVSNTASLMFGQSTHIVPQQQRWNTAKTMREAWIPQGTLLAKILFGVPPSSLPFLQYVFSQCMFSLESILIMFFRVVMVKVFFFCLRTRLWWRIKADSVDLSSQRKQNLNSLCTFYICWIVSMEEIISSCLSFISQCS